MKNKKNIRGASIFFATLMAIFISGCAKENVEKEEAVNPPMSQNGSLATFAGGCFWCMEAPFETLDGVNEVISGYAGGTQEEATYKKVSTGETDHREAVQIIYDPKKIEYATLLETFFSQIDPTDSGGQFSDRGFQYTTAIYYHDEMQKQEAQKVIDRLEKEKKFERPIVTVVEPYTTFFMAEEYHQDFYKKSYEHYEAYKKASGRDEFISENWAKEAALEYSRENEEICLSYKCFKKPSKTNLKETLTDLQYDVTQEDGTERAYENEYWNLKEEGIYVDIVSGEPLFSSADKYDSQTGWPSFTKPISEDSIVKKTDLKLFYPRTEVRSKIADSHLGHLFDDGPEELGGQRWCINSAALKFIPKDELIGDYEEFKSLFP